MRLFNGTKVRNPIVMLTPVGKKKADEYMSTDIKAEIFMYLESNGASTVSDIASGIGQSPKIVERMVNKMERQHYVQFSRTGEMD